ncbi:MAG: alkaline phosphatase family protein, partial [Calditrichaeota bacterium]|nr:alkaline phosphatase family protein [Calditrichota bacterium]
WLIDALNASEAPFKMVVMGGQFLNPYNGYENYSGFPEEREQILRAISENDIYGVIFFDGDRHHSELSKLDRPGRYPIYDLTVSPFTAGPNPNAATEANYLRVENTFYGDRNFALLEVSGPRKDRVLKISLRDKTGAERWQQEIRAQALR